MNPTSRQFGFRSARIAGPAWNLLKTGAQMAVFWSLFLWVVPRALARLERSLDIPGFVFPASVAWTVLVLASLLGIASAVTMACQGAGTPLPIDAPRRLVVRGPYRHLRNPMAVAGLTQGACVACLLGSWFALGLVAAGLVVWNFAVRPVEERDLESCFGEAYRDYRAQVLCWIPRFPGYRPPPESGVTRRGS